MSEDSNDQEWLTFKILHDKPSDMWSIRWDCSTCDKKTMGKPVVLRAIGEEIQKRLPIYICDRCIEIVATYQKIKNPTPLPAPLPEPKKPPEQENMDISRSIPCRNHIEFKDNCMACLNSNYRKKF